MPIASNPWIFAATPQVTEQDVNAMKLAFAMVEKAWMESQVAMVAYAHALANTGTPADEKAMPRGLVAQYSYLRDMAGVAKQWNDAMGSAQVAVGISREPVRMRVYQMETFWWDGWKNPSVLVADYSKADSPTTGWLLHSPEGLGLMSHALYKPVGLLASVNGLAFLDPRAEQAKGEFDSRYIRTFGDLTEVTNEQTLHLLASKMWDAKGWFDRATANVVYAWNQAHPEQALAQPEQPPPPGPPAMLPRDPHPEATVPQGALVPVTATSPGPTPRTSEGPSGWKVAGAVLFVAAVASLAWALTAEAGHRA